MFFMLKIEVQGLKLVLCRDLFPAPTKLRKEQDESVDCL